MRCLFDLPPIQLRISEYRAARKRCPHCGRFFTTEFPEGVTAPTQSGPGMQAVMSYLQAWQLLPHERTAQVCEDLFGHRPSRSPLTTNGSAKAFCVIRSYLVTARQQGVNIIDSIRNAVLGNPQYFATGAEWLPLLARLQSQTGC